MQRVNVRGRGCMVVCSDGWPAFRRTAVSSGLLQEAGIVSEAAQEKRAWGRKNSRGQTEPESCSSHYIKEGGGGGGYVTACGFSLRNSS